MIASNDLERVSIENTIELFDITSYDAIMCTDIYSQWYYAHWHLRQCFKKSSSLANQDTIFVDKS